MKVIVLADDVQKAELLSCPIDEALQIEWLTAPCSLPQDLPAEACIDLLFENDPGRIQWLRQLKAPVIVINSVIVPLEAIGDGIVRINGWNTFLSRAVVEAAGKDERLKEKAGQLFQYFGRKTEWVPDIPGFITPRIVVSIINEAFLALGEKVSEEAEIDIAMRLGTNYPYGPFEWGQKIGLNKVYSLLEVLGNDQNRYKPSILLREKILV